MKCPKCNTELPEDSKVCASCGTDLSGSGVREEVKTEAVETTETVTAAESVPAEPVLEPVKKSNTKKFVIGGAVVAVIAVICVFAATLMGGKDPKTTVIDAFKSIYADDTVKPMEEIFGFKELAENAGKENSQIEFDLKLVDSVEPTLQSFSGSGMGMQARYDVVNKKYDVDMTIQYNNMDFATMKMYMDETNLMVAVPDLTGKVLTLDYANDLEGQIENSPFLGKMAQQSGMNLEAFSDYMNYVKSIYESGDTDVLGIQDLWKRYKEGSKAIDNLKAAMTVTKKDKKTFLVDGEDVKCQGYDAVITKEAAIEFVKVSSKFFLEDETFKKKFLEYMTQVVNLSGEVYGLSTFGQSAEELQNEAWGQAQLMVDELIKNMEEGLGDITMTVYVDKKGRMASADISTDITSSEDGSVVNAKLHMDFKGGVYLTQNMNAELRLSDGTDNVVLTMVKEGTYDKKDLTCDVTLGISEGTNTYAVDYAGKYNTESGDLTMKFGASEGGNEMFSLSMEGIVSNLVKGKSFDTSFDTISVTAGGENLVTLAGNYNFGPLEGEVTVPEGEQMDMLAATEEDWGGVITEIINNLYALLLGTQL